MKIEAKNPETPYQACAATIVDVRPGEVKVHIDGRGEKQDYWCPSSSVDIHPCMWSGKQLKGPVKPPPGYEAETFKWNVYLANPDVRPAPAHVFNMVSTTMDIASNCPGISGTVQLCPVFRIAF